MPRLWPRLQYGSRCIHARAKPQFVVFHRSELDSYLADQARRRGAIIYENEPVNSFSIDEGGVTVSTRQAEYRARALVAADGSKGIARKTLDRGGRRRRVARLLETVVPAAAGRKSINPPRVTIAIIGPFFVGRRSTLERMPDSEMVENPYAA